MISIKKGLVVFSLLAINFFFGQKVKVTVIKTFTVDSLGACQGVYLNKGKIYLYGDRDFGVIRTYKLKGENLRFIGRETKLSAKGKDVINHPTGIAVDPTTGTAFIGNSSRMNEAGTSWKASIFKVNWKELIHSRTLDDVKFSEIEDDAAVQGTRPELVTFKDKNFVATADYGQKNNKVRLYDISKLSSAEKTSDIGIMAYQFPSGPWVQNLHFIAKKKYLVLVQNQIEGKYWRLSFVDFEKSLKGGKQQIISQTDIADSSELEGFAMVDKTTAIAVTSAKKNNVFLLKIIFDK